MAPCENFSALDTFKTPGFRDGSKSYDPDFLGSVLGGETAANDTGCPLWNATGKADPNCSFTTTLGEDSVRLNKFQIIKAVVLAGVTVVIMISVCRMVFQLFVRYNVRHDR